MELAIVAVTAALGLAMALLVLQKNPRSATNVYFALLVLCIAAYTVINFLALRATDDQSALAWSKAILLVSIPQGPLLYFFARTFPGRAYVFKPRLQLVILAWVAANLIFAFAGLLFSAVTVDSGRPVIQPGPLIPSFGLLHLSTIVAGLSVLYVKYRHASGAKRRQLVFIFGGVLISFSLTFLITFILPIFLNNTILLAISPLFLALSLVAAAYAMVAQKLFDIRAAAVRAVTYLLLIALISAVYSLVIFGLVDSLLARAEYETLRRVLSVAAIVVLILAFQPIRRGIDRLTNRLFFRNGYDIREVLNALSDIIVAEIDMTRMQHGTHRVLVQALKPSFLRFVLTGSDAPGTAPLSTTALQHIRSELTIAEELPESSSLHGALYKANVAVVLRLRTRQQTVGYVLLGEKQNGNLYDAVDIHLLTIAARELSVAMQNALRFEEIQRFNETLQQKVNIATRRLQDSNEKLKSLDETKDDFISMASHQMRTPLTSVKGYLSLVLEGDAGNITATQRKLLTQAFISSQRMVYLIADLLNVSRLKTGKFIIEKTPVNLAEVVKGELDQLKETAEGRELTLRYDRPSDFPLVELDETKTRQVIMNFVDNAIYYTPAGGHITVSLRDLSKSIELRITDDGIGVPRHEQHHLFTKFYRAKNAQKARPDGTGLGLFMARKVIVAQGGAIIFSSAEGKGSTFGFSLPKQAPEHTAL